MAGWVGRVVEQSSRGQQTAAPGRGREAIWVNYGNRTVTRHDTGARVETEWKTAEYERESNRTENIGLQRDTAQGREWFEIKAVKKKRSVFVCVVVVQQWEALACYYE